MMRKIEFSEKFVSLAIIDVSWSLGVGQGVGSDLGSARYLANGSVCTIRSTEIISLFSILGLL